MLAHSLQNLTEVQEYSNPDRSNFFDSVEEGAFFLASIQSLHTLRDKHDVSTPFDVETSDGPRLILEQSLHRSTESQDNSFGFFNRRLNSSLHVLQTLKEGHDTNSCSSVTL
jgi:hypothetical protein